MTAALAFSALSGCYVVSGPDGQLWHVVPGYTGAPAGVPAQMRQGDHWYRGTSDAIFQNLNLIDDERPTHVMVFGADHIYRMDPRPMLKQHIQTGAGLTVAGIRENSANSARTCASTSSKRWYQCSNGSWVDRWSDPDPCNGEYPL